MPSIYLERREPARNRLRFYAITVTRTLFDGWAVIREWGRIGQPGTVRETWFATESAAIEAGEKVRQRKEKRGYRALVDNVACGNHLAESTRGRAKTMKTKARDIA